MEIAPVQTNLVMAVAARQAEAQTAIQMAVLKQIAEGQRQMAEMLHALGVGAQVDLQA